MRSKTSATLASLMGLRMYRLAGGFRAYRKWVVETLGQIKELPPCYVLNGYTGTGKTELLSRLAEKGYPVLDLEGMAGHRGSIFGQIGMTPNNQKTFESLLVHELLRWKDAPFLVLEGESKRVGKVVLPDFLVQAKETGKTLYLEMPVAERVKHIIADYKPHEHQQECLESFLRIRSRIHTPVAAEIHQLLLDERYDEAVKLLLMHYYDPRYQHATERYDSGRVEVRARNLEEALGKVTANLPAI